MKNRNALALVTAVAMSVVASAGRADVITTSAIFDLTLPAPVAVDGFFPVDAASVPGSISLNLFDPTLGSLTRVDIELLSAFTGGIDVSGTADLPGPFGAMATGSADFDLSFDVIAGGFSTGTGTVTSSCGGDFDGIDLVTGSCSSMDPFGGAFDSSSTVALGDLSAFIGPGAFGMSLLLGPIGVDVLDPIGNFNLTFDGPFGSIDAAWSGTVTVAYTFTAATGVPEPSTALLLGVSAIGMGIARRQKRKPGPGRA